MEENLKQLLLVDLCARLPHGIKAKYISDNLIVYGSGIFTLTSCDMNGYCGLGDYQTDIRASLKEFKPYLRPISSMTEEERKEYQKIKDNISYVNGWLNYHIVDDWLNKNMFDYRNLIEKGLALKAKEGMYNLKD